MFLSSEESTLKKKEGHATEHSNNVVSAGEGREKDKRGEETLRTSSVQLSRRYWIRDGIDKVQSR